MCLLDAVTEWSNEQILCISTSHCRADNPLRAGGQLGAVCGIEYAAQAMAAHGALIANDESKPRQGYLASVRSVTLHTGRLDDILQPLIIEAERLSGDASNILYRFLIRDDQRPLLEGRAAVILDASLVEVTRL